MAATMTKKRMTEIARQARRYGYYRHSDRDGGVTCPQCRQEVHAARYGTETWPKALDAAMLDHLPACTILLAARDGEDISNASLDALDTALDLAPLNSVVSVTLRREYDARNAAEHA